MVNAPAAASSSMSSSNGKAAAYATLVSSSNGVQGQGLSTAFPSHPFAPSLSHLSGSGRLPPGYAKASPSQTHATFLPDIEQSANDDRAYRLIKLDNGMECLIVSDPKTDKSAAGISVRVGHLSDPENAQGMAHFCEHLLFMGTEKYPSENDYNEYLSRNNGQSNAYTAMDETVYYFDVHPPALPGALDRFAQFFIAPLFTDSCTEREILAVDSENKKNLQSDMWRMYQLEKSTSSKQHSYWRFGTGNKQTLWDDPVSQGRNVRSELLEWYGRHYSANVMKLVVLGKDSLDDLTKLVSETFATVKNHDLPPPIFNGSPFTSTELSQHIYAQAVKNIRSLEFTFPCADQTPLFATKPGNFITHYLGHEGEGSVLSYLKKLGWAESLGAGAGQGATGFDFFKISVQLTSTGFENHEKVAGIIFAYIDMLRSQEEPQEWAFNEQAMLNEISFRFLEKGKPSGYVTQLCSQMQKPYPREWLLSAPWLLKSWDPKLVKAQLATLTPENCRITVVAQDEVLGKELDRKEQWYGTKYRIEPFSEQILRHPKVDEFGQELFLPKPNSFIPSNLDILGDKKAGKESSKRPTCVYQTPTARLWHKLDDKWWVPRATVSMYIKNPIMDSTAANAIHTKLFLELVMDSMSEYSYDADLAGLSYRLETQADGVLLTIDGYNDKLSVLAKVVLEKMAGLEIDTQRFEIFKDQQKRALGNFNLAAPSGLSAFYTTYLTQNKAHLPQDKLAILDSITPDSLKAYMPELLSKLHIESLIHGNMLKEDAINIVSMAENIFRPVSLSEKEKTSPLSLLVPDGSNMILRLPVPNPENVNSAIEYFCLTGDDGDAAVRTRTMLLTQLINEPCFDTLRTKEQLGYLVHSTGRASIGMTGLRISIQSERDAHYLEDRVDAFLNTFEGYLSSMSDEQFEKEQASLVNRLREEPKNLVFETTGYWMQIFSGYYDFERKARDADKIEKLSKDDMINFFQKRISPNSQERAKISVHMQSQHASKATVDATRQAIKAAGAEETEALQAALDAQPSLLADKLIEVVGTEVKGAASVQAKIRESHAPASIGEKKEIFTDGQEIRKRMKLGPPASPTDEYKEILAKL